MSTQYDPAKHHRRSIRLKGWDYRTPGLYFVTICTKYRENLFENHRYREIAESAWRAIPSKPHARHVALDEWVVMPNHLHGIIVISHTDPKGGASKTRPTVTDTNTNPHALSLLQNAPAGSLGVIVGSYKSMVTRRINKLRGTPGGKAWQRGYYERIIRDERELNAIRKYIAENPLRWTEDRDNLDRLTTRMKLAGR